MSGFLRFKLIPFRFLLYPEWVMIGSCALLAAIEGLQKKIFPLQHALILLLLVLTSSTLPKKQLINKIIYTAIELGLIFYGTFIGYLHILPTLYLIVVTRSCFMFETVGRWIVAGLSFVLFLVSQWQYFNNNFAKIPMEQQHHFWMHQIAEILVFGLGIFLVLNLVDTLLREREKQDQLAFAHQQLKSYSIQVQELAAIQERNRIAREIHDSLGHALTALNVQLQTVKRLWYEDPHQAEEFLAESQKLGRIAIEEVRRSVKSLRADERERQDFKKSIFTLLRDFSQSTGLVIFSNIAITNKLPPAIEDAFYRVLQEGLTNVYKHSRSATVLVLIQTSFTSATLEIKDDGRGFILDSNPTGFGLGNMRERITALKGTLEIETQPNSGCKIIVKIPF